MLYQLSYPVDLWATGAGFEPVALPKERFANVVRAGIRHAHENENLKEQDRRNVTTAKRDQDG